MKQMGVIVQKSIDRNNGADFKLKDPLKVATVMTMSALNTTFVGETVQIVLMGRFVGLKLPHLFDDKGQSFFFAFLIGSVDGGDWGKDPEPEPTCPIAPELVPS
jgi:hypothetical protein